jgi:pyruvate, orthophosphate dikinase
MIEQTPAWRSSALEVNLERTAAAVEIPEKHLALLRIVDGHYGLSKRTRELLTELNHPYVNWEYVLKELKTLSIGDFYVYNMHDNGLEAITIILSIYLDIIRSGSAAEVKESGIRYLFDYLNMLLASNDRFLSRNLSLLPSLFETLKEEAQDPSGIWKKCSAYTKPILRTILDEGLESQSGNFEDFLYPLFRACYVFWLGQPDPSTWLGPDGGEPNVAPGFGTLVEPLSHSHLQTLLERLEHLHHGIGAGDKDRVREYLDMPDHTQIVNGYLLVADEVERSEMYAGHEHLVKLDFLFNVLNVPGLADVHGIALREVNRCLTKVFRETEREDLNGYVRRIFGLLRRCARKTQFQNTIIDCITTTGKEIFDQNSHPLVDTFIDELISFGFQYPEVRGSTADWQVQVNPAHVKNIRAWLEIISMKPRWTKRLLSALIINLKLKGIFVRDTDLLQRDISGLLNTDIAPAYNLVKQLLRIFPIYFNEIGAEGELREISTRVDELCFREDKLVYFLRKQSHVESNSLLVGFVEDVLRFWCSGDKTCIKPHLPPEVFDQIDNKGEYFDGLHSIFAVLFPKAGDDPLAFLDWDAPRMERELKAIDSVAERDKERASLTVRLYQLLYKKYNPDHLDLLKDLEASCVFDPSKIRSLGRNLHRRDYYKSLTVILDFLSTLKETILSAEKTPFFENIYYKRHIAAGIPSMYGTYREDKFEAVGLSLRLERLSAVLFEELTRSLNLKFITKSTLTRIYDCLWLYLKALDLEGIATEGLLAKMKYIESALDIKQFSIDQYIDIFQFISKGIQDIIRDYYIDVHRSNLPVIVAQMLSKYAPADAPATNPDYEEAIYQQSENLIRAQISSAFGLQVLDNLVNSIIQTLSEELAKFKENKQILNLVMAYTPELTISRIYRADRRTDNQILIGNKGYYLKQLAALNFPVPPGFILTTEVFRGYEAVLGYKYIFKDISHRIYSEILKLEKVAGRKFGDPRNPLLLSVRSGATISLPGMMHSFLNVGITEAIAEGLSRKKDFQWAAWDSYRRFLQGWGMFQGLERDFFDEIINSFKQRYGISRKIEFDPDQMRQIATSYKKAMEQRGIEVPEEPADQLRQAILQVFASWYSDQARIYRHQMHLSDEWGTAVIVQAMVFGNLNKNSGSGVIFTRNPKGLSPEVTLHGDFIFGVQGDDIVSGLVTTFPISEKQRIAEHRESPISLEQRFPEIYGELVRLSEILIYEKGFNHQEIEFTFENAMRKGLSILQTRDMVQIKARKLKRFKDTPELARSLLGTGIGVSGGALCGRAVYSAKEIDRFRSDEPDTPLILIRPDTVPDDVGVLLKVEGLLTARGGGTSHAAVTIPQLDKVGVVGFSKLQVYEAESYSVIEGTRVKGGDFVSIDGWSGSVYLGKHDTEREESHQITL